MSRTITVSASGRYDILIQSGCLDFCGTRMRTLFSASRTAVIADSRVAALYLDRVCASLRNADFDPVCFVFPEGEWSKTLETWATLQSFLAKNRLTRSDPLVALGGGVTGDLTGFAGATYLRGVPFVQIPTSLLAMVDSSVGGKTGVDLPEGKNLTGAFWQPSLVLIDPDVLRTLSADQFSDGSAEVIKYGMIFDRNLFDRLQNGFPQDAVEEIIGTCVDWKRQVVEEDEFDNARRQLLNYGHTVGHAVELLSNFSLSHGQSVAIGMSVVATAADRLCLSESPCADLLRQTLSAHSLPTVCPYDAASLLQVMLRDKKVRGNHIQLVIPSAIGACRLYPTPVDTLLTFLEAGL